MIDVVTSVGRIVAVNDADAIEQYERLTQQRLDELRAYMSTVKIMDENGVIHPMPDVS